MRPVLVVLHSVLCVLFWSSVSWATTYYVATSGSDSNNGTALSTPFRTIGKAASVVNPGDVVNVRGGTYNEAITLNRGGTFGNPVTFQRYQTETPLMQGSGQGVAGVQINALNIVWDGIKVTGYGENGILLTNSSIASSYTIIKNSELYGNHAGGNAAGVQVLSYYPGTLEITNNTFHDNTGGGSPANNTGVTIFMDGLSTSATSLVWVHHNECYSEASCFKYKHGSPQPNPSATAIFEYNLGHDITNGGFGCLISEQPRTIIRNNICYNTTSDVNAAIYVGTNGGAGVCTNCQVYNNTLYNVIKGIYAVSSSVGLIAHDNIFVTSSGPFASDGSGILLGNPIGALAAGNFNFYAGAALSAGRAVIAGWDINSVVTYTFTQLQGQGYEANGRTGNPLFVNPTGTPPNFHLQAGSPAKGAGTGGVDMGAYPTGAEIIGPQGGGGPDTSPPNPPTNLTAQ